MDVDQDSIVDPTTPEEFQATVPPAPPVSPDDPDFDVLDIPMQKQRTGLRWIVGSGIVLLMGVGAWLGYQTVGSQTAYPVEVVTAPVGRENLEVTITEAGVVELGGQQTVKAPNDVTVQAVLVEERQRVTQGQVLLELRDRRLQQELSNQLVQNRIDQLTLQRARERLQERRSRLADAENRLQDSAELLEQGYIAEDEFRRDKQAAEDALSAVRDAEVDMSKAELQVQQNQVRTESIRLQLEDNQIVAPINALILNIDVKAGDGVEREGRLLSFGDPTQERIRLQMTTLNASKVAVNMPVRVSVIGPNPEVFEGRIVQVSPQAVSTQDNAEQATVEAEARLLQPSGVLIPGSAVSVEVVLERRRNALVVPVTALQRDAEMPYVWVKDADGNAQRREVEMGLETLESVEIVAGLAAGDEIVVSVPPEATIRPGQPLAEPQPESDRGSNPAAGDR